MAETEPSRSDRVNIDESVMHIYKALTEESNIETSPFKTYKDVFMFAALCGYRKGERRKLPGGKKSTIRREVFTEDDFVFLKAIAIAHTHDVNVLLQLGDILTIAEEYAHAGIYDLEADLLEQGGRALWNLVGMLNT
ncbi:MAG: hypothetical protein JXA33_27075 [Anaerolineae bacterium]|nr:hypothetical protein [Anaerolineae bacterium]